MRWGSPVGSGLGGDEGSLWGLLHLGTSRWGTHRTSIVAGEWEGNSCLGLAATCCPESSTQALLTWLLWAPGHGSFCKDKGECISPGPGRVGGRDPQPCWAAQRGWQQPVSSCGSLASGSLPIFFLSIFFLTFGFRLFPSTFLHSCFSVTWVKSPIRIVLLL